MAGIKSQPKMAISTKKNHIIWLFLLFLNNDILNVKFLFDFEEKE